MIYVMMHRHGGKESNLLAQALGRHREGRVYYFPDTLHPEDQVKLVKDIVKGKGDYNHKDCYIWTHSLTTIYALNNELLRNDKLEVKAYELLPKGKKKSAINKRWIDESILGHVADELQQEMNKLYMAKFGKRSAA